MCEIPRLIPLFRYAPLEKRGNFPHSRKIFLIFNMAGSCKNILVFIKSNGLNSPYSRPQKQVNNSFWWGYFIVRALYSILTFSSQCWPLVHFYVVISIDTKVMKINHLFLPNRKTAVIWYKKVFSHYFLMTAFFLRIPDTSEMQYI